MSKKSKKKKKRLWAIQMVRWMFKSRTYTAFTVLALLVLCLAGNPAALEELVTAILWFTGVVLVIVGLAYAITYLMCYIRERSGEEPRYQENISRVGANLERVAYAPFRSNTRLIISIVLVAIVMNGLHPSLFPALLLGIKTMMGALLPLAIAIGVLWLGAKMLYKAL